MNLQTPSFQPKTAENAGDTLKALQTRHQALQNASIRHQAELEGATAELKAAEAEAKEMFGTSDINELRALYETTQTENQSKLAEFSEKIDGIEREYQAAIGAQQ